jgi:hypothetical protein
MIRGVHAMFYSTQSDEVRDFLKNKLALPHTDVGEGWLIFDVAEGDIGIHPTNDAASNGKHDISFYTDDLEGTVRELKGRGVEFTGPIEDHGYGLVTHFLMPGGMKVQLYQARYRKNSDEARAAAAKKSAAPAKKKSAPAKKPAPRKSAAKKAAPKKQSRR